LIDEAYAHDVDLWGRYMQWRSDMDRHTCSDSSGRALTTMSVSYITAAVERYGRVAASRSAEPRHPFLDRRVIEFHAWIPRHLRRTVAWTKWVLRTAIEPFVPAGTAWAGRRPHLGSRFNICGVKELPEWCSTRALHTVLGARLDRRKTERAIERARNSGHEADPTALLSVVLTSGWLSNVRVRTRREPAVGQTELVMN
jgi:asparagine synthase (glutamine-hydrolysing)